MLDEANGAQPAAANLRSVAIQLNGLDSQLSLLIAQILSEEYGSRIHLYTRTERERRGIERVVASILPPGIIETIAVTRQIDTGLTDVVADEPAVVAAARAWEARLGETFNELLLDHRQLSRGYIPGGTGIPPALKVRQASYAQTINAVTQVLEFWEEEKRTKNLTLILNAEKWVACFCYASGIQYRRRVLARHENLHYWSPDEYFTDPFRKQCYDELKEWPPISESLRYSGQVSKNKQNLSTHSYSYICRSIFRNLARTVYHRLRGERHSPSGFWADLRMNFRPRKGYRVYNRYAQTKLRDLIGREFIYFPLHKEPETDFVAASPEFLNQLNAISSLSRDLPAGAILAIKEHIPAFGLRPDNFYEQLSYLKNVVMVDAHESSIGLLLEARATATIAGTAGLEASILGRPVIQFGRHSLNHFLEHVFTVYREDDIGRYLRDIFNGNVDLERAKSDGARFLEATKRSCFDMGDFLVSTVAGRGASLDNAKTACQGLLKSLESGVVRDQSWVVVDDNKAAIGVGRRYCAPVSK
tara:strand:- start:40 stop:1632 length:1593 start_codon:yes stop_codon:yes gene_type:complete